MATNTWIAAGAGNWSTAGNWSLGHKPAAGEDVVLDNTSVFACTLNVSSAISLASFTIADNYTGTFTMNAAEYIYSTGSVYFGTGCAVVADATSGVYWSGAAAVSLTTSGAVLGAVNHYGTNTLTLQDALTTSGPVYICGPIAQNGKAIVSGGLFTNTVAASVYDAALSVGGDVTFSIAAPVSFPTTLTMTATGYLSVVAGGVLRHVTIDAGAGTVTLSTNISCANFVIASGNFTSANNSITASGYIDFSGSTLNLGTSTVTLTGDTKPCIIAATTRNTTNATIVWTGTSPQIRFANGGAVTILRLVLPAGESVEWRDNLAAALITISTKNAADWDNATWVSENPGSPYHISAPAASVVTGLNVTDCHNVGAVIDASDGTCTDGGGNEGFDFGGGAIPVMFNHYRRLRAA